MTNEVSKYVSFVLEFHRECGYEHNMVPSLEDEKRRKLWMTLIREEMEELFRGIRDENLISVADGICDCLYVIIGAGVSFGLPLDELFEEVHRSNMSKLAGGQLHRNDGKVLKNANFDPPDLERIISIYANKDR